MYDTEKRVRLVKQRVRRRLRRGVYRMSALCTVLFAALVGIAGGLDGGVASAQMGMYGTVLLRENAGGYVLVGVISFAAAVLITLLCIRYRDNAKKRDPAQEENEEERGA